MGSFVRPAAPRQGGRASRRARRNEAVHRIYAGCSEIAGPLDFSPEPWVEFRRVATRSQRVTLTLLASLNALTGLVFISWLLMPAHVPGAGVLGIGGWKLAIARFSFCVVVAVELIRLVQNLAVWVFASKAADPIPKAPQAGLRVAMLTTIVPAKEPLHVAERTLRAMLAVRYRGRVDVWILDEGNDPRVKEMARRLGVLHFSRKGIPAFNQPSGQFRAKTKSGNHNAWRYQFERYYDVVAQMDPDHAPLPCFLKRTLGYFRDPDVAFVVAPQVYGNMYENWVAHGASVQQYLFSGVVERAGNGLDAPLLIGTNHLYRPSAWREIGGYQDAMVEDHMTGMRVQGTVNPGTGDNWLGVYTPDVLAIGEGPASWTDYFNQQKRWAYGIWEILLKPKLKAGIRLERHQRLLYGLVQFYYPSVAATTLLGTVATSIYLLLGITAISINGGQWLALWSASMISWLILWLWLRRFNLAEHERREIGVLGMVLALFAGPVYVAAGVTALLHRRLAYAVTAKGSLRSADSFKTFRLHILWATASLALLAASYSFHHDLVALRVWASLAVIAGLGPPAIALTGRLATAKSGGHRASEHTAYGTAAAESATMGERHPSARVPPPRQAVRRAQTPVPHSSTRDAEPAAIDGLRALAHLSASQQAVREARTGTAHSSKRNLAVSSLPQARLHRQRADEDWDRHYEAKAR
jgi:cellulose synthase (UDP-forming)